MASSSSAPSELTNFPYISFLSAYPQPAFILRSRKLAGKGAPSLRPVFGNHAFRSLLFGPDIDMSEQPLGLAFLNALGTVERAQQLTDWLERGSTRSGRNNGDILCLSIKPSWTTLDADPVQLDVTQTHMDGFIVCTTSPRSPLPRLAPQPHSPTNTRTSRLSRDRDVSMRLTDFQEASQLYMTLPIPFSLIRTRKSGNGGGSSSGSGSGSAGSSAPSSRSPDRSHTDAFTKSPSTAPGEMKEMIENHDWHQTPLGPRSAWPASLRAAVSYVLASPYPHAVWWGPEVVLIYNDAYREMAGSKHPRIFAQRGSQSWGELWESIGPLIKRVFTGEPIFRRDDLLFFHRLTEAKLPEETYHNWSYVPVEQEDGTVGGIINNTFESTQKVIAERRMVALRDLSQRAGLARTQTDFADAVLKVLDAVKYDAPFAAFYFATASDGRVHSRDAPRTSYIHKSVDEPPIRVELRRAGTVAIPDDHPVVPPVIELLLDPLTLRASPKAQDRTVSPLSSGTRSQERSHPNQDSISIGEASQELKVPLHSKITCPSSGPGSGESTNTLTPIPGPSASVSKSPSVSSSTSQSSLGDVQTGFAWPIEDAFSTRRSVHVPSIPRHAVEGFQIRGWNEHAREAVVIPITTDDADLPVAVLILGLNSRRPYDEDYEAWIELTRLALNSLLTAVKGRESDLKRAEQLAELDDAKTAFFSNASHELRTPLTLIQGPIQDCLETVKDKRAKECLKMASRNVQRLMRLVDSLMDFSKLAANRLEGRFRPMQLGIFTADLASLFRSVIEKNRIEYIVKCDTNDHKVSYVDPEFWEKIVFNLIGNAFKYTMKGTIRVTIEYNDETAKFCVQDTGVGIPNSDLDKIFERFHRVDAINSRSQEGTGIGLSLTKELVKLHGGKLSVESKALTEYTDDHGSTFTVAIPLGKDHLPAAHIVQAPSDSGRSLHYAKGIVDEATHWVLRQNDGHTPSDSSESAGSTNDSSRLDPNTLFFSKSDVILLIDDNSDMRQYMKSLFLPFCKVVEAANGQEALDMLDRGDVKPNLILCDIMMPVVDGYGLISGVRSRPDTRLAPVILVTAKGSEDARIEGLLSGADDYVSKPFTSRELIARVHLQMQLGKRRVELEGKFLERTGEIRILSDLSPVGIIRVDTDGRVLYFNPRWRDISGLEDDAPIESWSERICEQDKDAVSQEWENAVRNHASSSRGFMFQNGKYVKGQFEPLFTDANTCVGVIGTITDVSDRRMYEEAQLAIAQEREASARKRAEEADERRRGQELLIDVTSHELRQPVSAILNCSSLVRSNLGVLRDELFKSCEEQVYFEPTQSLIKAIDDDLDALDAIYQCGLAQERIANDVLSLSRIQLQVLSIHPVEFGLVGEVQRIVSIFRNEVKMKHINLGLQFGESLDKYGISRVCCDKARFGQVITNLLSNGIKFTDTSSDKRDILVTVDVSRQRPKEGEPCCSPIANKAEEEIDHSKPFTIYVFVAVKDSGPGLKPDDLTLLFKRFQQGSNSHNVFGGSGLGLFVSRKLCDLMGGRIDVDSTFGKGATFRFFIEAKTVVREDDDDPLLEQPASMEFGAMDAEINVPLHILITEDNLINQTVLKRQLQKAGCTIDVASNGLQALEKIQALAASAQMGKSPRQNFDAILMDCEMPVMDGLTAVRSIRNLENAGVLPSRNRIIALTGNARGAQVQSAKDAGMDDVIIKPYKLGELLEKVQGNDNE